MARCSNSQELFDLLANVSLSGDREKCKYLLKVFDKIWSKLPFWSLWLGHFCHFSPNLKLFTSGSMWFAFCFHFSPKLKISHFYCFKVPFLSLSAGVVWSF
ncbi:hypothetical protein Hanom_Chr11g01000491 [Helianthus anomalus]